MYFSLCRGGGPKFLISIMIVKQDNHYFQLFNSSKFWFCLAPPPRPWIWNIILGFLLVISKNIFLLHFLCSESISYYLFAFLPMWFWGWGIAHYMRVVVVVVYVVVNVVEVLVAKVHIYIEVQVIIWKNTGRKIDQVDGKWGRGVARGFWWRPYQFVHFMISVNSKFSNCNNLERKTHV